MYPGSEHLTETTSVDHYVQVMPNRGSRVIIPSSGSIEGMVSPRRFNHGAESRTVMACPK